MTDDGRIGADERSPEGILPGSAIEVLNPGIERGRVRHALFDFDGTISLIRRGWQEVMAALMVRAISETPEAGGRGEIEREVDDLIARTTGRQTVEQMAMLADEVRGRGGRPRSAEDYKAQYLEDLARCVEERREALRSGAIMPEALTVPGALDAIEWLSERGVILHIASGTDHEAVVAEAELLGIAGRFETIQGALPDPDAFSKAAVIDALAKVAPGPQLVGFGDGVVETEHTAAVGSIAVGVASDERRRSGVDAWKRGRLIAAGADVIVPDFREHERMMRWLCCEEG
ncbi:MAG: HAD family hydrolase [Armatimonadota bacterium]|jgi:phosphoglycolate phosphatase